MFYTENKELAKNMIKLRIKEWEPEYERLIKELKESLKTFDKELIPAGISLLEELKNSLRSVKSVKLKLKFKEI